MYALSSYTLITRCNSRGHSTGESGDQKRSQLERLKHNARFASPWMEGRKRGEERTEKEGKQAAQALRPTARQLARPPAGVLPPDAATTAAGGERSRVLPQEEGGSDAPNARPSLAAETPNDDDATRIAPAGNGKGGESLTLLNCS